MLAASDIAAWQLALALLLDVVVGEYPNFIHPVVWIGNTVKALLWLAPRSGWWAQLLFGNALVAVVCTLTGWAAILAMSWAKHDVVMEIVVGGVVLKASFALCELGRAAFRVAKPIEHGDLPAAREALRSLCSRNPSDLDAQELLAGTVESLAENASDSFAAPLLYFLLFGVPGALVYRAINTMDAMIGYRGKYEALGKAAARLDDVANWIPARLTAVFLLLAGWLSGRSALAGWRIWRRDSGKTPSPNAGQPMAVMAGLLGVRLEKKNEYVLGDSVNELMPAMVWQAWGLVVRVAMVILWLTFAIMATGFGAA